MISAQFAALAQLVEQMALNHLVGGSSPPRRTTGLLKCPEIVPNLRSSTTYLYVRFTAVLDSKRSQNIFPAPVLLITFMRR